MEINKIYNENCLDTMAKMEANFIDLTVTSPPYDNLRTYKGFEFDWQKVIKELYRTTKNGGVVVWIVGDATISFKQALYAIECGFKLHDTMIWNKGGFTAVGALKTRYAQVFEYMFVFVKGKLKTFNPLKDRLNKNQTGTFLKNKRLADGTIGEVGKYGQRNKYGQRFNIWKLANTDRSKHPAIFPEKLVKDHIISWSNKGDLVYDCFMGSGTTAKMAILNNRKWIGSEMSLEYCDILHERLKQFDNDIFLNDND
jgi:site-specific DNA-methyltransferase (adenine-specific)